MSGALRIERTNTILYCEGFAETVDFYRDVFGFDVTFDDRTLGDRGEAQTRVEGAVEVSLVGTQS